MEGSGADGVGPVQVCPGGTWWAKGLQPQCPPRQTARILLLSQVFTWLRRADIHVRSFPRRHRGWGSHTVPAPVNSKQVCSSDVTCQVCALRWTRTEQAQLLPGSLLVGGVLGEMEGAGGGGQHA